VVERCVGAPAAFEELKHKPGCRLTLRARGPRGSAIVKLYRSDRAPLVAERIAALADGLREPEVPAVLAADADHRVLVLSDFAGTPLREAILEHDLPECRRAGAAIARWHDAWASRKPSVLEEHPIEAELTALVDRAALASREICERVAAALHSVCDPWEPATVVHRNLHEEQILLGDRVVGLIDVDEVALGPAELDMGNLVAHVDLLELRSEHDLFEPTAALLEGYATMGTLDPGLLERCRTLSRLRLACVHDEPRLLAEPVARDRATVAADVESQMLDRKFPRAG
jgi:aminoglycoside phosphotransferase (APT) family kinase protein